MCKGAVRPRFKTFILKLLKQRHMPTCMMVEQRRGRNPLGGHVLDIKTNVFSLLATGQFGLTMLIRVFGRALYPALGPRRRSIAGLVNWYRTIVNNPLIRTATRNHGQIFYVRPSRCTHEIFVLCLMIALLGIFFLSFCLVNKRCHCPRTLSKLNRVRPGLVLSRAALASPRQNPVFVIRLVKISGDEFDNFPAGMSMAR